MAADISALMSSLWYWELAGYGTLVAVAIGVAGESVHELTDRFKGFSWWKAKGGKASALLLIAALAGEVVTQVKTSSISGQIIAFLSDQNLTLESEVLKLRAAATWREFSRDQHDQVVALVRALPRMPTSTLSVESVVGSPEAQRYGSLLAKALSDALGVVIAEPRGLSTCLQCSGVWVCVDSDASPAAIEDGKAIREVFEQSRVVGAKFCTDPQNGIGSPTTVRIIVGPKE